MDNFNMNSQKKPSYTKNTTIQVVKTEVKTFAVGNLGKPY